MTVSRYETGTTVIRWDWLGRAVAIFRIVMIQSLLVGLAGFLLGLPVAYGTTWLARYAVPEWSTLFLWQDVALVLAAALIMSAVAAYLPIQRVARVDPAIVFRA